MRLIKQQGLMVVKPNMTTLEEMLEYFTTLKALHDGDQELIYKYFASKQRVNRISQNYLLFVGRCDCMGEMKMPQRYPLSSSVRALHYSGHVINFKTASLNSRKDEPCVQDTYPIWEGFYKRMRTVVDAAMGNKYNYNDGPSGLD